MNGCLALRNLQNIMSYCDNCFQLTVHVKYKLYNFQPEFQFFIAKNLEMMKIQGADMNSSYW